MTLGGGGGAQADLLIRLRARNDASRQIEDGGQKTEKTSRGLAGMGRAFTTLGLGTIGAGFALRAINGIMGEAAVAEVRLETVLKRLGPAVEQAVEALLSYSMALDVPAFYRAARRRRRRRRLLMMIGAAGAALLAIIAGLFWLGGLLSSR
ncbi:MAG: hypothetical protein IIC46_07725 [Planctomycetes bacterium]|nr:hypothetical protein [Planctomycetota bacterium]